MINFNIIAKDLKEIYNDEFNHIAIQILNAAMEYNSQLFVEIEDDVDNIINRLVENGFSVEKIEDKFNVTHLIKW